MGTMLYAQGVFINRSFDSLNLSDPERVLAVHQAYAQSGADVARDQHVRGQPNQAARLWSGRSSSRDQRSRCPSGARRRGRVGLRRGRDRSARPSHRAVGPNGTGRGAGILPRAGPGAPRRRRGPLHPRNVSRSERDPRGNCRCPQRVRAAHRRADDHRGRRQYAGRHAAGAVCASAAGVRGRCDRPQLQHRPRAHAGDARAHDRGDRGRAVGAAQRRPAARRRGADDLSDVARVHGVLREAFRRAAGPSRRRMLRHDARSHRPDQVGAVESWRARRPTQVRRVRLVAWTSHRRRRRCRRTCHSIRRRSLSSAGPLRTGVGSG